MQPLVRIRNFFQKYFSYLTNPKLLNGCVLIILAGHKHKEQNPFGHATVLPSLQTS